MVKKGKTGWKQPVFLLENQQCFIVLPDSVFLCHPRALFFIVIAGLRFLLCHPRAPTRGSTFQSTILTVENNGATRSLWHSAFNPPRACRAGHPRALFFIVIAGLRFLLCHPRALFFLVIAGLDPAIQVKHKANLLTWILGSSPRMT